MTLISDWQRQAADYMTQQRYREAIALYQQSIVAEPMLMSNYWYLGLALLLYGRELEAQNTWRSVIAQGTPAQVEVWKAELVSVLTEEALQREAKGNFHVALIVRQQIRHLEPKNFNNLLAFILLVFKLEGFGPDTQQALSQATQLLPFITYQPINNPLIVQLFTIFLEREQFDPLVTNFFEACLDSYFLNSEENTVTFIKEELAWVYSLKCCGHWQKREYYESEVMANKALRLQPNSPGIYFNLGMALGAQGKLEQAAISIEKALEIDSNFSEARKTLSHIYIKIYQERWKKSKYGEAAIIAQKALKLEESSAQLHWDAAIAFYFEGLFRRNPDKLDEAATIFQRLLQIDPDYPRVSERLSTIPYLKQFVSKGYYITADCFTDVMSIWEKHLKHLAHLPLNILEIGSFEGMATCWLIDNILTHESARITCIDNFEGVWEKKKHDSHNQRSLEDRFDYNMVKTGAPEKVHKIVGFSQKVMRSLPLNSYNLVYIDGSHRASDVLEDVIIAWGLVKVGGLIVFDDYNFVYAQNPAWNPKIGIDAFLTVYADKINMIYQEYRQVIVEKIAE